MKSLIALALSTSSAAFAQSSAQLKVSEVTKDLSCNFDTIGNDITEGGADPIDGYNCYPSYVDFENSLKSQYDILKIEPADQQTQTLANGNYKYESSSQGKTIVRRVSVKFYYFTTSP